jgi:hypothetical protein
MIGSPEATTCTEPSERFITCPLIFSFPAMRRIQLLNPTFCTLPDIRISTVFRRSPPFGKGTVRVTRTGRTGYENGMHAVELKYSQVLYELFYFISPELVREVQPRLHGLKQVWKGMGR